MNAKEIVKINNDLREKLSEENKKVYEDMLVYIRTNTNKSEQQTEEVLLELLEHLLAAQADGKTVQDIFGNDIKQYCDEIINEIPGEKRSISLLFGAYLFINLFGIMSLTYGTLGFFFNRVFHLGSSNVEISLGSTIVNFLIDAVLIYIFVIIILKWIKSTTFKQKETKKWVEFFQIWLVSTLFIGIMVIINIFMPSFGLAITIPNLFFTAVGILLVITSSVLNKKYRITK
jgi:DNA-binding ferritin-like protein (Dps family)